MRIVTPRQPCCGKRNYHQILGYPFSVVMSCGFLEVCLNMSPPETLQPCDNLVNKPVAKIYVGLFCDHTIYAYIVLYNYIPWISIRYIMYLHDVVAFSCCFIASHNGCQACRSPTRLARSGTGWPGSVVGILIEY